MDKNSKSVFELKIDQSTENKLSNNLRRRVRKAKIKLKIFNFIKRMLDNIFIKLG
jgi:CRISPR/Cas system-associated endoribonuclease Cas2